MIEGFKAISQIVTTQPFRIIEIIAEKGRNIQGYDIKSVSYLNPRQFVSISTTKKSQGVICVASLPEESYTSSAPENPGHRILFLEDIQDPGNIGTLIRTAAAFGFNGVVLTDKCADPFSPKAVQASAGSLFSLWIRRAQDSGRLIRRLKSEGYYILAADLNGRSYEFVKTERPIVLALGSEGSGLSRMTAENADFLFEIPVNKKSVDSLNVAAAGAICMYLLSATSVRKE